MIFLHKKVVPEQRTSESRQEWENKERRWKYAVSVSVSSFQNLSTIYFKSWQDELNQGNLRTNISSVRSNSRQQTHIPSCVDFSSLQLQRHESMFMLTCQDLRLYFAMFQFRFRVWKNMVQMSSRNMGLLGPKKFFRKFADSHPL